MKADFVLRIRGPIPVDSYAQEAAEEDLCFDYPAGSLQEGFSEEVKDPRFWPFTEQQGMEPEAEEMEVNHSELSESIPIGPPTYADSSLFHKPSPVVLHDEADTELQTETA